MKFRSRWPLELLLVALVVLGARLAWMLTNSTTGWNVHLDQWAAAIANLFGAETTRLSDQTPDLQARFWLNQVSKIQSSNDDSQVAMGAAWMLDSPQFGFKKRHIRTLKKVDFPGIAAGWRPEIDIEAIRTQTEEFESICRSECLSRIDTATRIDSENVELWRARALLSFKWTYGNLDSKPRRDDWLAILSNCAEHDPDNALYDYLAALHLWSSSADYDSDEQGYLLKTTDRATFDQGTARMAAGLAKRDLQFDNSSYLATMAFLNASSMNCLDRLTAAESRNIDGRATNLLFLIVRWQSVLVDAEKRNEDFAAAATNVRKVLRISDQITDANHDFNLRTLQLILRRWGLANLKEMNDQHLNPLDVEETENISVDLDQVRLDLEVQNEIGRRWTAKTNEEDRKNRGGLAFLAKMVAQQFVIVALGLGLFFGLGGRIFAAASSDERVRIGWITHILAWLVGIGGSFFLLGVFQFDVKAWIAPMMWKDASSLHLTQHELQEAMSLKELKWIWAFFQWQVHQGVLAASLIAAGALFTWSLICQSRRVQETHHEKLRFHQRSHLRHASDAVARSCVVTSLVFALAYLGSAPTVVESTDEYHKLHYQRLVNPSQTQREIEATAAQIKSDDILMRKLRAEIAERQREISEQVRHGGK